MESRARPIAGSPFCPNVCARQTQGSFVVGHKSVARLISRYTKNLSTDARSVERKPRAELKTKTNNDKQAPPTTNKWPDRIQTNTPQQTENNCSRSLFGRPFVSASCRLLARRPLPAPQGTGPARCHFRLCGPRTRPTNWPARLRPRAGRAREDSFASHRLDLAWPILTSGPGGGAGGGGTGIRRQHVDQQWLWRGPQLSGADINQNQPPLCCLLAARRPQRSAPTGRARPRA